MVGVPPNLRRDFIYRNSNNLHVSEFHGLIRSLLASLVGSEVETKVSPQALPSVSDFDTKDAIIFITSVKPLFQPTTRQRRYAFNQVKDFQHSSPYTLEGGKAQAKTIDAQWKRNVVLSVKEPFPFMYCRQPIVHRRSTELCPIEVSIDDIQERIDSMRQELNGVVVLNNLMRLVQGSVMPQVFFTSLPTPH